VRGAARVLYDKSRPYRDLMIDGKSIRQAIIGYRALTKCSTPGSVTILVIVNLQHEAVT
jgi:hypothetical protein